ncbi:tRNA pseudouridine synthase A [Monoraphidium neglectum]|uniref:tRNA pseudouridine synthase n=1 Tax=Monoraphidium neglectum TaxID=145388 RepID=A0A0D2MTA6_9CHLO|nr:tRNA pseudouridine synthase A [Monoraphidium neglectum]KIZ05810.1 tRNA pseudouridine synthase A [Monoraphidium neglectum]|eukprot:XP_013904829.1 tRNA pseudouridine synthase A [Monoraphidium neglectum]
MTSSVAACVAAGCLAAAAAAFGHLAGSCGSIAPARAASAGSSAGADGGTLGGLARGAASAGAAAAAPAAVPPPQLAPDIGTHSFRLLIAYDGTDYSGWQLQPHAPTVQLHLERALTTVLREPRETLCVIAAGRTDAGVHAAGQVVQFRTNRPRAVDPARLPKRLNSLLPHNIRVSGAAATAPDFLVTSCATGKAR